MSASEEERSYTSSLAHGYKRTTLLIDSETKGWSLEVWEITPQQVEGPWPTVVMAHGFGLSKIHGLEGIAANFAKKGFASLVFDYRHLGGSDGKPRNKISPKKQIEDYYTVVKYARLHPKLYEARSIGIWGFSLSGGHVLTLAAQDDHLAFVIAQNPYSNGLAQAAALNPFHALRLGTFAMVSMAQQIFKEPPIYIRAAGRGKKWGVLNMKEAAGGYESVGYDVNDDRVNRVDASIALQLLFYDPVYFGGLGEIRVPVLLCIGNSDTMVPWKEAHDAAKQIPRSTLLEFRGDHFSAFPQGPAFEEVSAAQVRFIKRHSLGTMSDRLSTYAGSRRSVRRR